MIKKTVTYTDFDDNQVTEDLYFHVSKTELLDNVHLRLEVQELSNRLEGASRELSETDIKDMVAFVRKLIDLSYGVRSEDGRRFRKSADILEDFHDSPAYDEVLFGLFKNPEEANDFLRNVIPKDLLESVQEPGERPKPQDHLAKAEPVKEETDKEAYIRELEAKLKGEQAGIEQI